MSGLLQAQPLDQGGRFNWVFLIEILVNGILGLFFLFYFNRLFATVLSYAIRAYTWHAYRAHIDITALQISLLGGRVFFKGITYHGHNITVYVHSGHITWRYWLITVRDAAIFAKPPSPERAADHASSGLSSESNESHAGPSANDKPKVSAGEADKPRGPEKQPPCRISVKLSGFEAFIYNQSPKYDAVVDAAKRRPDCSTRPHSGQDTYSDGREDSDMPHDDKDQTAEEAIGSAPRRPETRSSTTSRAQQAPSDLPRFLQLLPISIECRRAAATFGNENTTNVLTAKVEQSAGVIDASQAGSLDIYKLLLHFEFENVQVALKPNRDFRQLQLDAARRVLDNLGTAGDPSAHAGPSSSQPAGFWQKLCSKFLKSPRHESVPSKAPSLRSMRSEKQASFEEPSEGSPLNQEWQGLNRYMNDGAQDEHDEWSQVEYAKASQLVDVPKVVMCFYWDIPGRVPESQDDAGSSTTAMRDDSPEYGLKLSVYGGEIVYGPWADRQRIVLQNVFFPASYVNTSPAPPPQPGDLRAPTEFNIAITLEDDVTLRIPMREQSKDHKWKGRAEQTNISEADELHEPFTASPKDNTRRKQRKGTAGPVASDLRHYAWLDVTVKKSSNIRYQMDMFAGTKGFGNLLRVQLQGIEMQSSVNHGLLWRSGILDLSADLSYPLEWNGLRKWPFQIVCHDLELFILRDHLFLIIDLVNDWASGGPPEFNTFVPFVYLMNIEFRNFRMYLNVNDANIINDPAELDKNDFLTLEGQLQATLTIPMEHYRPQRSEISFDVLAEKLQMRMLSSPKSTLATFITEKQMATLQRLTLSGSFSACQILEAKASDVLRMDLVGSGLKLTAFGCFVRQLINLKENYFGDHMHFKTLEEFQTAGATQGESNDDVDTSPKPRASNELDVIICIVVEDAIVALPTNLYSAKTAIRAELPRAELDLRVNSYYLDIEVDLAPISILEGSAETILDDSSQAERSSATQIYISSANVSGHRMLGPAPKEFAYVSHWNVSVGQIRGEMLATFLNDVVSAGKAFAFSMQDGENALPLVAVEAVHDITFAQISVGSIRLWSHAGDDAFVLMARPTTIDVSGWRNDDFSQRVTITLPQVTVASVAAVDAPRLDNDDVVPAKTHAFIQTGLAVELIGRRAHVKTELANQQNHLRQNDERTNRAVCLQLASLSRDLDGNDIGHVEPAVMPLPDVAPPLGQKDQPGAGMLSRNTRAPFGDASFADSQSSLTGSIRALIPPTGQIEAQHLPAPKHSLSAQAQKVEDEQDYLQRANRRGFSPAEGRAAHAQHNRSGVPFSSPYAEPYFPLDAFRPDETDVPPYPPSLPPVTGLNGSGSSVDADIADIEHECEQMTVMIHIMPGIRAFATPQVAMAVSNMLEGLSPKTADDVMDAYHIEVMNIIESRLAKALNKGKILELKVAVPAAHLRFFCNPLAEKDRGALNILLGSFDLALRSRSLPSPEDREDTLVMHTNLESMRISLQSITRNSREAKEPAVEMVIRDALAWFVLSDMNSVHLSFREHSFVVSGGQTAYLVDLVLASLPLVEHLIKKFGALHKNNANRIRLLMFFLTNNSDNLGDPQFMTRMVYTLRAHPNHFRNQDSWKILSRFRYILHNLPETARMELCQLMETDSINCPPNAHLFVVQSWSQWRNWDVPYVSQTVAFSTAFKTYSKAEEATDSRPITLTVKSERCRMGVSHGNQFSDVVLGDISLGVETTPPTPPQGLMLLEENKRARTIVQMHMGSIGISLCWALLDVVEAVLQRRESLTGIGTLGVGEPSREDAGSEADDRPRHDLHLILSTDSGQIDISSRILRHVSQANSLKLSLVSTTRASQELGQCASAMLNFDSLTTELFGPAKRVLRTSILSPSLYIDHLQPLLRDGNLPTVTVAIAFHELQTVVDEQLPGILHVIENVINEDVARMQSLFSMMSNAEVQNDPEQAISPVPTTGEHTNGGLLLTDLRFHVAVLAGTAHVEVSLLQSLIYRLESKTTSIRVAPCLGKERTFDIDFDVRGQNHFVVNLSAPKRHVSGIFEVPPVNGHVRLELGRQVTSILGDITIQKIEVQAGAVQELTGVISQPEVQNVISAIQDGISRIKERISQLDSHTLDTSHDNRREAIPIKFDVRLAVLGVRVSASTPGLKAQSIAELEFGIGPMNVTARSRGAQPRKNYNLPEITAEIQHIGGSLRIKEEAGWQSCGHLRFDIHTQFTEGADHNSPIQRQLHLRSDRFEVNAYPDTVATIMAMFNHLQDRIKHLDLSGELEYLRRIGLGKRQEVLQRLGGNRSDSEEAGQFSPEHLLSIKTQIQFQNIQLRWITDGHAASQKTASDQTLVFSILSVELATQGANGAQLTLQGVKLEITDRDSGLELSPNSAVLPEVAFRVAYWSRDRDRSIALKASGRPVDIRLESRFLIPLNRVQRSIERAVQQYRTGSRLWQGTPAKAGSSRSLDFDFKRLRSLLVEAEFAGATVHMQGFGSDDRNLSGAATALQQERQATARSKGPRNGKPAAPPISTSLTAPGMALKLEYDTGLEQPTLHVEIRVDASSNTLLPNVVPLALEVSNSIKEIISSSDGSNSPSSTAAADTVLEARSQPKFLQEESIVTANPAKIFGRTKVDVGFRICRQEFGLSCQPIAKVDAKASLEDFYFAINTIESEEHGHFFASSAVITNVSAQVKHMYSREPTFSYDMDSIVLSAMNNKHLSGTSGVSAILNLNPTKIFVNGKQFQDLLLFQEIWLPSEIRNAVPVAATVESASDKQEEYFAQKYQTVAAAAAFPWNATLHVTQLSVDVDLGQSIGKSSFTVHDLWASQQKSSSWEQSLCLGINEVAVTSKGRMGGSVVLTGMAIRTSIQWPEEGPDGEARRDPLIQASIGFERLRAKTAFDYQAFAFGDIENFDFLMYNVRDPSRDTKDRLVAVLDCAKAYVFCISTGAAQAVALYQAFDRLVQEKQAAFEQSVREIEKHMRRESVTASKVPPLVVQSQPDHVTPTSVTRKKNKKTVLSLHTDVVVTIKVISLGVFPSTFFDSQLLKLEANEIQARFAVGLEGSKITSRLGMTLGQLQVGLSTVKRANAVPKALEVSVDEVIHSAVSAKGGTIVRVPRVIASMQTWQVPDSSSVDYIFKSVFEGKIDVGWNLARINFIKSMWTTHTRALASRLGTPLPESAFKITAGPINESGSANAPGNGGTETSVQEKITAEIKLPQSRYDYHALAPPVIETPQLRDMGEATPPLEWIGLQRERLPHVTHQIIIVTLLEVCREVEEAYERILGSS